MNSFKSSLSVIDSDDFKMITVSDGEHTAFVGVADNRIAGKPSANHLLLKALNDRTRERDLLIRAVNNRTRERNYFRLCTNLLEEEITAEEFDQEIAANEDDYVVTTNQDAGPDDIQAALALRSRLKDVKDVDDMADLFSFSPRSIHQSIEEP